MNDIQEINIVQIISSEKYTYSSFEDLRTTPDIVRVKEQKLNEFQNLLLIKKLQKRFISKVTSE